MQTAQPRSQPVWGPGFSRPGRANPVRGCLSIDANLSGRIVTTSRRQRTAALQSRSSHDYGLLHPYLVRHLASDALRLWRAAVRSFSLWKERPAKPNLFFSPASIHRQPLTGFNKPGNSSHRGKSRLIAVNRAKKITFPSPQCNSCKGWRITKIFASGQMGLPLPRGEGRGEGEETLRTEPRVLFRIFAPICAICSSSKKSFLRSPRLCGA